jgi:hypothetical protein
VCLPLTCSYTCTYYCQQQQREPAAELTLEQFTALADCNVWTPSMDACIVQIMTDCAEQCNALTAMALSPQQLHTALATPAARSALQAAAGATSSSTSSSVSLAAAAARSTVLRAFNNALVHTLPYCDVTPALALQHSTGACQLSFRWGCSASGSQGFGPLVTRLKGSVLLRTKEALLRGLLSATATRAAKAEDEYDYPSDLPLVSLNRPRAAAAASFADSSARLAGCLFGQLWRELLEQSRRRKSSSSGSIGGAAALRMAYAHPMDDGQERAFKVRFEGEGVGTLLLLMLLICYILECNACVDHVSRW